MQRAKPLDGLSQSTLPLLPMPRGAYKDVIEGPARRFAEAGDKLTIEPQLTQRLLEDIDKGGGSDALPLLAFTLEQLFLGLPPLGRAAAARLRGFRWPQGGDRRGGRARACSGRTTTREFQRNARSARRCCDAASSPGSRASTPKRRPRAATSPTAPKFPMKPRPLIDLLVEERLLSTDTIVSKDAESAHRDDRAGA